MQLEIFTLCDAATEHAGKLNIIGTFDVLRGLEAPFAHPQCAIAGRLRFEQIEEGNHRVSLTFADEDGNIVMVARNSLARPISRDRHLTATSLEVRRLGSSHGSIPPFIHALKEAICSFVRGSKGAAGIGSSLLVMRL